MKPSIILVSPRGERNVGGVARLMGNFELQDLRLVSPRCEWKSLEAKKMSMQSFSILQEARVFETLTEAQADLEYSIALSGRREDEHRPRLNLFQYMQRFPELVNANTKM